MIPSARRIGSELCELWGLDPHSVAGVSIDIPADGFVRAVVKLRTGQDLTPVLRRYRLVPIDEEES